MEIWISMQEDQMKIFFPLDCQDKSKNDKKNSELK